MTITQVAEPGVEPLFARLDEMIDTTWKEAADGDFWSYVSRFGFRVGLYRDLMAQIYHYTRFNSVNQAVTVLGTPPEERALLRFAYRHADEELGHEMMVVHDLKSLGLVASQEDLNQVPRVPATDALVNYLVGLGCTEGAVGRLGYSYWAEDVYAHIAPLLDAARLSLGLEDRQMTFFVAHSEIDDGHAAEVRRILAKVATTPERQDAVFRVAQTTLWLTTQIMEQTFQAWMATQAGYA